MPAMLAARGDSVAKVTFQPMRFDQSVSDMAELGGEVGVDVENVHGKYDKSEMRKTRNRHSTSSRQENRGRMSK